MLRQEVTKLYKDAVPAVELCMCVCARREPMPGEQLCWDTEMRAMLQLGVTQLHAVILLAIQLLSCHCEATTLLVARLQLRYATAHLA